MSGAEQNLWSAPTQLWTAVSWNLLVLRVSRRLCFACLVCWRLSEHTVCHESSGLNCLMCLLCSIEVALTIHENFYSIMWKHQRGVILHALVVMICSASIFLGNLVQQIWTSDMAWRCSGKSNTVRYNISVSNARVYKVAPVLLKSWNLPTQLRLPIQSPRISEQEQTNEITCIDFV